jgi:hypothetical protein
MPQRQRSFRNPRQDLSDQAGSRHLRQKWSKVPVWSKVIGTLIVLTLAFVALPLVIAAFGFVILIFLAKIIIK